MWCVAKVIGERSEPGLGHEILVHYKGWKSKWDEWHLDRSHRLRPLPPAAEEQARGRVARE